jgi:uncharacterized protein (DUF488 family)
MILTIGHSTRPIDEFIGLLHAHGIELLVDVRTIPKSRYNPQFNTETLAASLQDAGIDYVHEPGLGGLRHPRKDSINLGWRNESFRGYADYMQTDAFRDNLERLIDLGSERRTVIMCAEAVPWRCHRSLISDALLARGITSLDIMGTGEPKPHGLTSFAVVSGTAVTYPDENLRLALG